MNTILIRLGYFGLILLFFSAPFTKSGVVQSIVPIIGTSNAMSFLAAGTMILIAAQKRFRIYLQKDVFWLLFIPIFLSLGFSGLNLFFLEQHLPYEIYSSQKLLTRTTNVILFFIIFFGGLSHIELQSQKVQKKIASFYLYGIIILAIFGIWQLLSYHLPIWYPSIQTRNHFHNAPQIVKSVFRFRVTSILNEPSFLAPFMIDGILLSFWIFSNHKLRKFIVCLLFLTVLFFSFSFGGMVNFALIAVAYSLMQVKIITRNLYAFRNYLPALLLFFIFSIAVLNIFELDFVNYIYNFIKSRISSSLSIENSRIFMVVKPFEWFLGDGLVAAIFGHGPGSYQLLQMTEFMPNGMPVQSSSNNFLSDILYECGFLGFLATIIFFIIIIKNGMTLSSNLKKVSLGFLLSAQLFIVSFYRGDYMSARFWILMILIYVVMNNESRRMVGESFEKDT